MGADPREAIDAVWRIEAARVIARVARLVGDVGLAEDFAHDALVAALEQWPESGVPDQPGAWLTTVARRRAIDDLRTRDRHAEKEPEVSHEIEARRVAGRRDLDDEIDDPVGDDLLGLMFTCCHPVLSRELGGGFGPYALQAAIAACHARARVAEETDWARIVALYDALSQVAPSPVVALNRAVAVGMAYGAEAGLELVDALAGESELDGYPHLPAVRGDLLERLGRVDEARTAFERAADLTRNDAERRILEGRARQAGRATGRTT